MSTSALFPTSLYTTDSTILGSTLTQSEWQQAAVEIEAIEAALGTSPQGTSTTVAARFANYSTAAGTSFSAISGAMTATQHGAIGTAATHPFSGLTGTFVATQHGALGTDATHPFSGLTGTFTDSQHTQFTTTAGGHPFSAITGVLTATQGGGAGGATAFSALSSSLGTSQTFSSAGAIYSFGGVNARSFQSTVNPSLSILPVANSAITTLASLDVQGNATSTTTTRTFLGHFGLTFTGGNTTGGDRVALYAGALANNSGGGAVWSLNTVLTMGTAASTSDAFFGYELDFNNMATHAGDATGAGGLGAGPFAYGLGITGASVYRSQAAILISGPQLTSQIQWNRGLVVASNVIAQATIQDFSSPDRFLDVRGDPTYVLAVDPLSTPSWLIYSPTVAPILFFGNLMMGSTAAHSTATETILMANGGAPTSAKTDALQFYSQDTSSGETAPAFFMEQVVATAAASFGTAATYVFKMRLNGTEYNILMQSA